jgi:hypothetical protein
LINTIVAGNTAPAIGPDVRGSISSGGYNLVGKTTGSFGWCSCDLTGTSASPLTPLLGALGSYGGSTQTMALLPGFPAIDAGDDPICAATGTGKVNSLDQRGISRLQGTHCDIGAFESRGFSLVKEAGDGQSVPATTAYPLHLLVSLASTHGEPVDGGGVTYNIVPTAGARATFGPQSDCTLANGNLTAVCTVSVGFAGSPQPTAGSTDGSFTVVASASGAPTQTFTLTVTDVAPIVTTTSGATAASGGAPPVVVDAGLTVSDVDNTTLASGTVHITANFHSSEDTLAFTSNPATMGNIAGSYNTGVGVLTLQSAGATATVGQWQAALRAVTYADTSLTPSTANRTVAFAINDGVLNSTAATKTVTVALPMIVTGIAPASGGTTGGNSVTLTGVGFDTPANTQVLLDGVALPAANITSVTGTQIVYVAPAHAAGSVVVTVKVSGATLAGSATYTYGVVNGLPPPRPSGGTGGSPNPLPSSRP